MASRGNMSKNVPIITERDLAKRDVPPSPDQLCILQEQIASVEREMLDIQGEIEQLRLRHAARAHVLEQHRSVLKLATAPARRLPPELLMEIFRWLWLLHQQDKPESCQICIPWKKKRRPWQFTLCHVCFAWRQAALDSHFLWTDIRVIAPKGSQLHCEDPEEDWDGHDKWISRLTYALNVLSVRGTVNIQVDIENANYDAQEVLEVAMEHLYYPFSSEGRRFSATIRGYYGQLVQFFALDLQHPEAFEHIILRDQGADWHFDILFDHNNSFSDFRKAVNLHRLDLIAENDQSLLFSDMIPERVDFPLEQLTHLVIQTPFATSGGDDVTLSTILWIPEGCTNLVHLTLIVGIEPFDEEEDEPMPLHLPFLESLVVAVEMKSFFRNLNLPSLSHLEIRGKRDPPLGDIAHFIRQSGCAIKRLFEINPNRRSLRGQSTFDPVSPRKCRKNEFEDLLNCLQDVETLNTITQLDEADLENIATGIYLPSVKVLQFYTDLHIGRVTQILRPRFKSNVDPSSNFTGFDEVVVSCLNKSQRRWPVYRDGTSFKTSFEPSQIHRVKLSASESMAYSESASASDSDYDL